MHNIGCLIKIVKQNPDKLIVGCKNLILDKHYSNDTTTRQLKILIKSIKKL